MALQVTRSPLTRQLLVQEVVESIDPPRPWLVSIFPTEDNHAYVFFFSQNFMTLAFMF